MNHLQSAANYNDFRRNIHAKRANSSSYWNMLSRDHGPDRVVQQLRELLTPGDTVFEIWAGRGRNALPLLQQWMMVTAQDIEQKLILDLGQSVGNLSGNLFCIVSDAAELNFADTYTAFVCTRVLHFLEFPEAEALLKKAQKATVSNGYHALVLFDDWSNPMRSPGTTAPFFPNDEYIQDMYSGWKQILQRTLPSTNAGDQVFEGREYILQKP